MSIETVNIFANPIAGRGRGKWTAQRLERRLGSDGFVVRTCLLPPDQITLADVDGEIRAAVIIGDNELAKCVAQLKDLDSGEQREVALDQLAAALKG